MTNYEFLYNGADDNLTPSYSPKIYDVEIGGSTVSNIGTAMDARTANQLGELRTKINPGQKVIEVGVIEPKTWEAVPTQHIEEIRRATKLAGISPSFHAPIVEASGFSRDGGWNESNREAAEKQLASAISRSQRLDPNGNISVTVHSTKELPEMIRRVKTKDATGKEVEKIMGAYMIDPASGQVRVIEQSKRFFKEGGEFEGKQIEFDPKKEIKNINELQWHNQLGGINTHIGNAESHISHALQRYVGTERAPEIKTKKEKKFFEVLGKIQKGTDIPTLKREDGLTETEINEIAREANHIGIYYKDAYGTLKSIFDKAYTSADEQDKKKLTDYAKESAPKVKNGLNFKPEEFENFREVITNGLKVLGEIKAPETFKPLNQFIIDQSSKTFANIAAKNFKEYGDKSPIINIENPPSGGGLSRAEDLRKLIEVSREKLIENLKKEGLSKSQAEKQSEKLIGATWDVGHINMLRKEGYSEEDVVKQTEIIAPFVKHMHLSDNFGLEHTELPMGMGNVPMKEIMKRLGEKGFEGKKIIEAGDWWQYFAEQGGGNPFKPTIEAFDSPIYAMKQGPSWGQLPMASSYYSGYGEVNPAIHHQTYGAGFTTLPTALGGNMPGAGDRSNFSGTPNQ